MENTQAAAATTGGAPTADSGRGGGTVASTFGRDGSRRVWLALMLVALSFSIVVALARADKGVEGFFGSAGSGNGQFATPQGVAVNDSGAGGVPAGSVYVVDAGNSRVQRFGPSGTYAAQFGGAGASGGQLTGALGVAVNQSSGDVYVTEQSNLRVQRFDAQGNFLSAFGRDVDTGGGTATEVCASAGDCQPGTAGSAGGEFGAGLLGGGIAVVPAGAPNAGNVVVSDPGNRRVQEFTAAGVFVRAFGFDVATGAPANGEDTGTAFEVCSAAVSGAANCKVAAAAGVDAGRFANLQPRRVAADSTGAIYTVETTNSGANARRVQKFSPQAGPPPLSPAVFAPGVLSATSTPLAPTDIAIGPADSVSVVKPFPAGATPSCPDTGAPSLDFERRVIELDSTGATLQATHAACARIASVNGLALAPGAGKLYLTSGDINRVFVLDDVAAPLATALAVTDVGPRSAVFHATVNPQGTETSWRFEYSDDGGASWRHTHSLNSQPSVGAGGADVQVDWEALGLDPGTGYQVRVVATKPFGNPSTTSAPVAFTTDPAPPEVHVAATTADDTTATLRSRVDPNGTPTGYQFEWGATTAYGSTVPPSAASAGSGNSADLVEQQIAGLQPDTTYHYRLVATSAAGAAAGPDRTLTTGPSLPDGRAYERVSPADKNGNDVMISSTRTRAAAAGDAAQFTSLGAFAGVQGTGIAAEYIAQRSQDGWATHGITPLQSPQLVGNLNNGGGDMRYMDELSPDLTTGVTLANRLLAPGGDDVGGLNNLYLRRDLRTPGAGGYQLLTDSEAGPMSAAPNYQPWLADTSEDFTHVIFNSELNLTGETAGSDPKLYESVDGDVRLAGVLPDSEGGGPAERSIAGRGSDYQAYMRHTVSRDGSRVFFTVDGDFGGRLYVRENGTSTMRINASEKTVPEAQQPAEFWDASADGSIVYFTTKERLTDDAPAGTVVNLYRADLDAPQGQRLTRISVDDQPADGMSEIAGVLGVSDDGEHVYFAAQSQLAAGGPPRSENGEFMLHHWDGHTGELSFVGALSNVNDRGENFDPKGWGLTPLRARVTPDGEHLLFSSRLLSSELLTGYDAGSCGISACRQLYVYSAEANNGEGELACASCRPDGVPATVDADNTSTTAHGTTSRTSHLGHAISDDGRRVFFTTAEMLVAGDVNSKEDVYVYHADRGELDLVSSGRSSSGSYFMDASASGDDVFFTTREQLVGSDIDNLVDIYDARVGGGLPDPVVEPECAGDGCQGPGSSWTDGVVAGSLAIFGSTDRRASGLRLGVGRLGEAARRRFARTGRVTLRLSVPRAGRLTVGSPQTGRRSLRIAGPGTRRVTLRLSGTARRQLAKQGRLRVRIDVRLGSASRSVALVLRRQGR